jgi:UDP-N-acetyl-D-galactosamine dehydrogenase
MPNHPETVCVVGAGYVGLPLSAAFARSCKVISFDIDEKKVQSLSRQETNPQHTYTSDPARISEADYVCICVPTPLTKSKDPDMSFVESAGRVVGKHLKKGAVVILESSVYPGVTQELLKPILEKESGWQCGVDFEVAYSPERINPGDVEHNVDKVTKIVAAENPRTLKRISELYGAVAPRIYQARDIKTAEAAKLVENIQRDLNIALVNELSMICDRLSLNTPDVLEAAATKWNFQRFSPGLVGGYCIPVVPYFMVAKAEEVGYHAQVILAGRAINDAMPKHIVDIVIKSLNKAGKVIRDSRVLIMGLSYKENVEDSRETPIREVIKELHEFEVEVLGYDPLVKNGEKDFGIRFLKDLSEARSLDCLIVPVAHNIFRDLSVPQLRAMMNHNPVMLDLRGLFDTPEMRGSDFLYRRL